MKKYIALALALSLSSVVLANPAVKQLQVPFVNESVEQESGLSANYNMNGTPSKKVVCTLSNLYKGWINYTENGAIKESGTYGGAQTVIFTNKGETRYISENLDQFHADAVGHLLIHHIDKKNGPTYLSCLYMDENNNK